MTDADAADLDPAADPASASDTDAAAAAADHAERIRIARRLMRLEKKVIGVAAMPAGDPDVDVMDFMERIGRAMVELGAPSVGLVEAWARWSADPRAAAPGGDRPARRALGDAMAALTFSASDVRDSFAAIAVLERGVPLATAHFSHLIIDLTGLDILGDHAPVRRILDGVVIVAASGRLRDSDLHRIKQFLPAPENLGLVLVGGG